eukprot:scaffold1667_cov411-Prasinococcus_capsulatus_cf.AAC.3
MVFREYEGLRSKGCDMYSRPNALRAFETLVDLGLVTHTDKHNMSSALKEFRLARMSCTVRELGRCVDTHSRAPVALKQWFKHDVVGGSAPVL